MVSQHLGVMGKQRERWVSKGGTLKDLGRQRNLGRGGPWGVFGGGRGVV
jgi:hypothetical protein